MCSVKDVFPGLRWPRGFDNCQNWHRVFLKHLYPLEYLGSSPFAEVDRYPGLLRHSVYDSRYRSWLNCIYWARAPRGKHTNYLRVLLPQHRAVDECSWSLRPAYTTRCDRRSLGTLTGLTSIRWFVENISQSCQADIDVLLSIISRNIVHTSMSFISDRSISYLTLADVFDPSISNVFSLLRTSLF